MPPLLPGLGFLLLLGWQGAAAGTQLCSSAPVNESAVCASVQSASQEQLLEVTRAQSPPCSLTFGQLACAQGSWLQDLQDDFLISFYSCLASNPPRALDPEYSILFFSKYDAKKLLVSLTLFSQRFSHVPLSLEWSLIFLNGLWERMLQVPGIETPPVLFQWLHEGLEPFLVDPKVFGCLHGKDVSCEEFQLLVAALDGIYSQLPVEEQRNIYTGIKYFLTQDGSSQKCYSEAIPSLNSTAWFRNYLGSFLEHATVQDLQLFWDEPTLQKFARDPVNVEMVGNLTLLRETALYYTLLLTSAPALPLSSLPDRLICYLSPGAVRQLSREEVLGAAQRLGKGCPWSRGTAGGTAPSSPASQRLQVASSLVSSLEDLSPAVLGALGQAALGLSVSRIQSSIPGESLAAALPALGRVRGWSPEQCRAIASKLLSSGYQVLDGQSLAELGTLLCGLNSSTVQSLSPDVVLEAIQLPAFAQHIDPLPSALKTILVEKVSSRVGHPAELVKLIPNALASYIPKPLLVFGEEKPNVQDLNNKPWTRDQAAIFFADVVKAEPDFSRLSQSVLQGFTCAAASAVGAGRFQELAKVMRRKKVRLGQDQLSCLLKMVTLHGIPEDLDSYPKDLLLFLSPSDYAATGSCRQFFSNVGKANQDVLPREAPRRQQLLLEALACLKVPGTQIHEEDAEVLGWLLCELGGDYIRSSGGSLLKGLSHCGSFLPEQEEAIRDVLSSGNTTFGPPASWSAFTLSELSGLIPVLDHSILQHVPKKALTTWLRNFAWDSALSRKELATIVEELQPRRHKREDGCPAGKEITEAVLDDDLMPTYYTPEELRACFRNASLESHFSQIAIYPFSNPQLAVLKEYLDERYPNGYPESLLSNLGDLLLLITPKDVSTWKMSSADMLAAFLKNKPSNSLASAAIKRYVELGNALNATALNAIGTSYLCLLNDTELEAINPQSLRLVSLDPSACSQEMKNILYQKAKKAFSDQHHLPAYYELILPYLEGAPAADLKALSKDNVNMNVSTFVALRRDSLMLLTPREVQGLLGLNLPELAQWQSRAPVRDWILLQKQSELDKLHIGLTGGTQEGYINLVTPKFPAPSSAPVGTVARALHLLPALLLSFLLVSSLS
ncbi:mesothelin [Oenanthe melanoleuca]|uniref:mesothelin n=1 Tax=Oenanthe melanoleuca TaxID=2939378 RepID=UPI0024C209E4|nr:mesothelin [Oenanthe melanoleuca]